ncbi:Tas retrotransposon peptidase A16, partial [Teladorsagia circumcincta]
SAHQQANGDAGREDNRRAPRSRTGITNQKASKPNAKVNTIGQDCPPNEVLELQAQRTSSPDLETFLPTGEVTVLDPNSKTLRKISVLLDTGAEISFIDSTLADELQLHSTGPVKLRLHTFGEERPKEKTCQHVVLNIWDKYGQPLSLSLLTHDILTKSFATPPMIKEDIEFMQALDPDIACRQQNTKVKPQVLLGSDQLWSLVCDDQPPIKLPSGLNLLPTRLGHLLTGQMKREGDFSSSKEMEKWDGYWTLDGR